MKKTKHIDFISILAILILGLIICKPKLVTNTINSFAKDGANKLSQKMEYAPYDNKQVTGFQIAAAQGIANANNINIYVKTLQDKEFIKYTKECPYNKSDKNNSKFNSTIIKNKNNKVIEIKFKEVGNTSN